MQTKLEINAIDKRLVLEVGNKFGKKNEYDESDAQKGGEGTGSISDHTLTNPDLSTGGSDVDVNGNKGIPYSGRIGNTLINEYREGRGYGVEIAVDTSANVNQGQYIVK